MSTTYTAFVTALEALTVTGVTRKFTQGQPNSLNTADLPAQWVDLPRGESVPATCAGDMTRTLTADLLVALEPVGQNTRPTNFDACVTMLDSLHTALDAADLGTDATPSWTSRLVFVTVNTIDYWAVSTEVTALG
jgi:hypothetical protein